MQFKETPSSPIQTVLSVLELHQFSPQCNTARSWTFTTGREFHPALKTNHIYICYYINYKRCKSACQARYYGFEMFFLRVLSGHSSQTAWNGSRTKKVVPTPGSLWTSISPSCASTIVFTIESPMPVPFCFEYVRDLSFL
ncbi:Hypothetical protein TFLO_1097 [Trichococcus flocculiformis]|uniref:Uncharacterized protein n=1 Tax=Trichococcus flocculiformis TaxID=82803 RepID=A0AB38BGF6_9LACT|nr:Hypothetical protein TFLO_1097 [Trichococcus flocculiformis]SFH65188.1 hypothetical protein SAMN04488507_100728 [Trichococcus flocculiformis]